MKILIICLYFLPSIIAIIFDKKHKLAIFVFNLLLGWFMWGLFWALALVWTLADETKGE